MFVIKGVFTIWAGTNLPLILIEIGWFIVFNTRDTLLVYLSVLLGNFVIQQLTNAKLTSNVTQVFTNEPSF